VLFLFLQTFIAYKYGINGMKLRIFVNFFFIITLGLFTSVSQSKIILVDFVFDEPLWSMTASYDDQTGHRWGDWFIGQYRYPPEGNAKTMVFGMVDFELKYDNLIWGISDLSRSTRGFPPPNSRPVYWLHGLVVDSNNGARYAGTGCLPLLDYCFGTSWSGFDPIIRSEIFIQTNTGIVSNSSNYIGFVRVSEPNLNIIIVFFALAIGGRMLRYKKS